MSSTQTAVTRSVARAAMALTVAVGAMAFALSFTALTDLARLAGIPESIAWMWPVVVDGAAVVAILAVWATSRAPTRERAYPWALLVLAVLVSVLGNAAHAVSWDEGLPLGIVIAVACVPPLALAALIHLVQTLSSRAVSAPQRARADKGAKPVSAPERVTERTAAQPAPSAEHPDSHAPLTAARRVSAKPARKPEPVSPQPLTAQRTAAEMIAWVSARLRANEQVSGTDVAERFGVSSATGRRRIAQARELMSAQEDLAA